MKLSSFYNLGHRRPPYDDLLPLLEHLLNAFGPRRLMWASDCPRQLALGQGYSASISLVRDRLDVSDQDREWLLWRTAEQVYFENAKAKR